MSESAAERSLETPRLVLEPLTGGHAPALFAGLGDDRLYRFIPQEPPVSLPWLAERYRRLEVRRSPDGSETWLNWAMRRRAGPGYVGLLEATVFADRTALIAYTVVVPHQRRGYAREGVARLIEHLFRDHAVAVVAAEVDTRNGASIGLLERLGFARVGERVGADFFNGASSDEYRYERREPGGLLEVRDEVGGLSPAGRELRPLDTIGRELPATPPGRRPCRPGR